MPVAALVLGTFLFHRGSLLSGLDGVQADLGDLRFVTAVLEHWRDVVHGAAAWRQMPIFWPARDTLAYSDALLGMGLIHAALRTGLPLFAAVNAQLVLLTGLSFAATYTWLGRGLGLSVWGATAGSAFAAFCWPRFGYLPHLQLQFTAPLPLVFLLVLEALRDGLELSGRGFLLRLGGAATLCALLLATVLYLAVFAALAVCGAVLLCLLHRGARGHLGAVLRRQWTGAAGALLWFVVLGAPVVWFYLPVIRESGGRSWAEVAAYLPRPLHLLWLGRENWVWGWAFARWPELEIEANWPELRIGVGAVATLAWVAGAVWAVRAVWRRRAGDGMVALVVLTGLLLQVVMVRWGDGRSAWWLVWLGFPGAGGIRAVARLELVVTLAMGAWLGFLVDRAVAAGVVWRGVAAGLALLCGVEQLGTTPLYSGRRMEAFERGVAAQLRVPCPAAYVVGTPDLRAGPAVDAATFDGAAYLAANPDVAAAWTGTPWAHYLAFGRAEGRALRPDQAPTGMLIIRAGYNDTLPLAAVLARKPVVNGYSGTQPVGWDLGNVLAADATARLGRWLGRHGLGADAACVVPIRITLDMLG